MFWPGPAALAVMPTLPEAFSLIWLMAGLVSTMAEGFGAEGTGAEKRTLLPSELVK